MLFKFFGRERIINQRGVFYFMAKKQKNAINPNMVFLACMFLGIGIGMLFGKTGPGTLIGMGVGFLAKYYVKNNQ